MLNDLSGQLGQLTNQQLAYELQNPTGAAPTYMVMAELQKRQQMEAGGVNSGQGGVPQSIRQQMIQQAMAAGSGGRAPLPTAMAAQEGSPVATNNSPPPGLGGLPPQQMMQQGAQGYARGGVVGFDDGGSTGSDDDNPYPTGSQALQAGQGYLNQGRQIFGVGQAPAALPVYFNQAQQMVSDPSQAYAPIINTMSEQAQRQAAQSKGQALMKAGLAMMSAPGSNILSGIAAGGAAGLDAYSQAQAAQRAMQMQMAQAQLQQANAHSQYLQGMAQLAQGERGQDTSIYNTGNQNALGWAQMGVGQDAARNKETADAQALLSQQASQQKIAGMSVDAQKSIAKTEDSRARDLAKIQYGSRDEASFNRLYAPVFDTIYKSTAANPQNLGKSAPEISQEASQAAYETVQKRMAFGKNKTQDTQPKPVIKFVPGTNGQPGRFVSIQGQ